MIRLIRAELSRLASRRISRVAPLLLVVSTIIAGASIIQSQLDWTYLSEERALEWYQTDYDYWQSYHEDGDYQTCLDDYADEDTEFIGSDTPEDWCGWPEPQAQDYQAGYDIEADLTGHLFLLGMLGLFTVLVIGASATAAEFAERTMGTWLTFVPRRGQVFGSKVLAPALIAVPIMLLQLAVVVGTAVVSVNLNDIPLTGTDEWDQVITMALRYTALAAVVAGVGAAVGMLLRRTAGVLGLALGYLIVIEGVVGMQLPGDAQRWLMGRNVTALVQDGHSWWTWDCAVMAEECTETVHLLTATDGLLYVGVVAAVLIAASFIRFWRADID